MLLFHMNYNINLIKDRSENGYIRYYSICSNPGKGVEKDALKRRQPRFWETGLEVFILFILLTSI